MQWELPKQGAGICIVMAEVGDAEPRVRRVLPKLQPLPVPVWLATHRELHTSRPRAAGPTPRGAVARRDDALN